MCLCTGVTLMITEIEDMNERERVSIERVEEGREEEVGIIGMPC